MVMPVPDHRVRAHRVPEQADPPVTGRAGAAHRDVDRAGARILSGPAVGLGSGSGLRP
jgi:hypothetical protein